MPAFAQIDKCLHLSAQIRHNTKSGIHSRQICKQFAADLKHTHTHTQESNQINKTLKAICSTQLRRRNLCVKFFLQNPQIMFELISTHPVRLKFTKPQKNAVESVEKYGKGNTNSHSHTQKKKKMST